MAKQGTVARLAGNGAFGFIKQDDGGPDVYFKPQWIRDASATVGLRVEYETRETPQGLQTSRVRVIGPSQTDMTSIPPSDTHTQHIPTVAQTGNEYRFLNPYNFVRYLKTRPQGNVLGDCPPPPHDRYVGLTGRITCFIEAVTPLFVSDSHAVDIEKIKIQDPYDSTRTVVKEHPIFRFFEYEGRPALPASSLRGMIRSVFEAVTNSCFGVFDGPRLSEHFDAKRTPWLVPARVMRIGEEWNLQLLTGTTPLQIERADKSSPEGKQYAAWAAQYWPPITPSKTLKGIESSSHPLNPGQRELRRKFIERTKRRFCNPDLVQHGEECYALLRAFQHPIPKVKFWDVVEIRRNRQDLPVIREQSNERIEKGWLCINNQNIEAKHSERFFFRAKDNQTGPETIELPPDVRKAYTDLISDYQKRHADTAHQHLQGHKAEKEPALSRFIYDLDERELRNGALVYAWLSGTPDAPIVDFIVPVAVPRVSYDYSVADVLAYAPHALPCRTYESLCPACRTFGWVHANPPKNHPDLLTAYAGRLCFSHGAFAEGQDLATLRLPDTPLAILGSPKPTTTQFYLLKDPGNGQLRPDGNVDYNDEHARLRGRKFYRHQGEAEPEEYKRATNEKHKGKDDQNRTVRGALGPGAKFTFTIDFENMAREELGALLWSLELEPGMYHRLGFAKPLGFGSVKLTVTEVSFVSPEQRYESKSLGEMSGWASYLSSSDEERVSNSDKKKIMDIVADFKKALQDIYKQPFSELLNVRDLSALLSQPPDLPIHYPRPQHQDPQTGQWLSTPDPEGKNFEWFVGNKKRKEMLALAVDEAGDNVKGLPMFDKTGKIFQP